MDCLAPPLARCLKAGFALVVGALAILFAPTPAWAASLTGHTPQVLLSLPNPIDIQGSPPKELLRLNSGEQRFFSSTGLAALSLSNTQTYERASEVASMSIDGRDRAIYYHPDGKEIGFAFKLEIRDAALSQGFSEILGSPGETYTFNPANPQNPSDVRLRLSVYLIQLRPIAAGSGLTLKLRSLYTVRATSTAGTVNTSFLLGAARVGAPPCQLSIPSNLTVSLPRIAATALPSVGSFAGATPFKLVYTCSGSSSARLRLDGTAVAGHSGVLANSVASGRAEGIGVQILRHYGDRAPLELNVASDIGFELQGNSVQQIPLLARYYRIGAISAGSVSSSAVFTLEYP